MIRDGRNIIGGKIGRIKMVTYNNLKRDYNMKMDDLTPQEGEHLIESLVREYYDAYDVDDVERINQLDGEIDETIKMMERGNFVNVRGFLYNTLLHYSSSLLQIKLKRETLTGFYKTLHTYVSLIKQLEGDLYLLHSLMRLYFFDYSETKITNVWDDLDIEHDISNIVGDDFFHELHERHGINSVFMNHMDRIISHVCDSILETQKMIEERFYSPNDSPQMLEENVSIIRNNLHDMIRDDSYSYQREKGLIDIEMGFINAMKVEHELNMRYKELKKAFNKLMRGNNGFSPIVHDFYNNFGRNYPSYKEFEKTYPKYNIRKSTYVPPDSRKDGKLFDSYFMLKNRDDI